MARLGNTWHTYFRKELPIGVPQLMMGFTADGQLDPTVLSERDRRFNIDSTKLRENRASIPAPPIAPGADGWQRGIAIQLSDPTGLEAH